MRLYVKPFKTISKLSLAIGIMHLAISHISDTIKSLGTRKREKNPPNIAIRIKL